MELTKGLAGTAHYLQVGAGIISAGGNVVEQAPEPVVIKEIDLPVRRMVKVQNGTLGLLGVDVLGHLIDVLHNFHRLFEYKGIHRLDDIGLGPSIRPQIIDLIGAVYIPHLDLLVGLKGPLNTEGLTNLLKLFFHVFVLLYVRSRALGSAGILA